MVWFSYGRFDSNSVVEVILEVPTIVDHLFVLCLIIFWNLRKTSLRIINALAPLSIKNNMIAHTCLLEFWFLSTVPGLI